MGFSLTGVKHLTLSTVNRSSNIAINVTFRYESSVGTATDYRLEDRSLIPCRDMRFFSPPLRPYRLWRQHNFLSNSYRGFCQGDKAAEAWR
jgi:hypothetical protein